jgi:hypothetical protein
MALASKKGPFFAVSVDFPSDARILSIPMNRRTAVVGTWTLCGAWSARQMTDGVIPAPIVESHGGTKADARMLVKVGLWDRVPGGFRFIKWDRYNFTRQEVEKSRADAAQRKAAWRAKPEAVEANALVDGDPGEDVPELSHGTNVSVPPMSHGSPTTTQPHAHALALSSNHLGGEASPEQREDQAPPKIQPCGKAHYPEENCGPCGAIRRGKEEAKAQRITDDAQRKRDAEKRDSDRRKAEDDAARADPADPVAVAELLAATRKTIADNKAATKGRDA